MLAAIRGTLIEVGYVVFCRCCEAFAETVDASGLDGITGLDGSLEAAAKIRYLWWHLFFTFFLIVLYMGHRRTVEGLGDEIRTRS